VVGCCCSGGKTQVVDIYDWNYDDDDDDDDVDVEDDDEHGGTCQLYLGLACDKYARGRAVFVRSEVQQSEMEARLKGESSLVGRCRSCQPVVLRFHPF